MTIKEKEALYEHLVQYISAQRRELFERKIHERRKDVALILENIHKEHNMAALIRTADAFGITNIFMLSNQKEIKINSRISKKSEKWLSTKNFQDINTMVDYIHGKRYKIFSTTPDQTKSTSIYEFKPSDPIAIIFSNEALGISKELEKKVDGTLSIPMRGYVESLNVSVSCGIILGALEINLTNRIPLSKEEKLDLKIQWTKKSLKSADLISNRFLEGL